MLLLLLLMLQADRELLGQLARLSPATLKDIALAIDMSSENLLASLGGRRPLPTGERIAKLRRSLGVNPDTGNLDNGHVFLWKLKPRNLGDFVAVSTLMFPAGTPVFRTDLIFNDLQDRVFLCIHSDHFLVVLIPCAGLSIDHLQAVTRPPAKLPFTKEQFCSMPADEATAKLRKGKPTWKDAIKLFQDLNISPEQAMEWADGVGRLKPKVD